MGIDYDKLRTLRNLLKEKDLLLDYYLSLEKRLDSKSKNILVICKSKSKVSEALKFVVQDYLDRAIIEKNKGRITIGDTTIIFMSITSFDLTGINYKQYYFLEDIYYGA